MLFGENEPTQLKTQWLGWMVKYNEEIRVNCILFFKLCFVCMEHRVWWCTRQCKTKDGLYCIFNKLFLFFLLSETNDKMWSCPVSFISPVYSISCLCGASQYTFTYIILFKIILFTRQGKPKKREFYFLFFCINQILEKSKETKTKRIVILPQYHASLMHEQYTRVHQLSQGAGQQVTWRHSNRRNICAFQHNVNKNKISYLLDFPSKQKMEKQTSFFINS